MRPCTPPPPLLSCSRCPSLMSPAGVRSSAVCWENMCAVYTVYSMSMTPLGYVIGHELLMAGAPQEGRRDRRYHMMSFLVCIDNCLSYLHPYPSKFIINFSFVLRGSEVTFSSRICSSDLDSVITGGSN